MATTIGESALTILLAPGTTDRELTRIKQYIDDLEKRRDEQEKSLEELASKQQKELDKGRQQVQKSRTTGGITGKIQQLVDQVLGPIETAANVAEFGLPKIGQMLESATKDTVLDEIGSYVNEKIQKIAQEVSALRADIDAVKPSLMKTVEYNVAALRLGGKIPPNQDAIIRQTWEIENAVQGMQRALKRDISNETIDTIFRGLKTLVGGGK